MIFKRLSLNGLRLIIPMLSLTSLLILSGTLLAQDTPPDEPLSVYLSNGTQLHQFKSDGGIERYDLSSDLAPFIGDNHDAFSPDGNEVAQCLTSAPVEPSRGAFGLSTLTIYDLATQTSRLEVPIGISFECTVMLDSYSQDGSRIAVGLVNPLESIEGTAEPLSPWELVVVDTVTGDRLAALDALHAGFSALDVDSSAWRSVSPMYVEGDLVYFMLDNTGPHGPLVAEGFVWNTVEDTVEAAPGWAYSAYRDDRILTADGFEFATVKWDESLPAAELYNTPPVNTVIVQREDGEPQVVYRNTVDHIEKVRYINDGQALLITLSRVFEGASNITFAAEQYQVVLTRDGSLSNLPESYASLRPISGGYLLFSEHYDFQTNVTSLVLDAVTHDGTTTILEDTDLTWQFVYATPPDLSAISLPEFVPFSLS